MTESRQSAQLRCEMCGCRVHEDEAVWLKDEDEYVCEPCADLYAERKADDYDQHLKESQDGYEQGA